MSILGGLGLGNVFGGGGGQNASNQALGAMNQLSAMGAINQQAYTDALRQQFAAERAEQQRRQDPNNKPAYQMPLSQLVTLWRIKFEDRWMNADQLADDEFWRDAAVRLQKARKFEEAEGIWVRLLEDA